MMPALLIEIDQIPLNNNGKADRKQLSQREVVHVNRNAYIAPANELVTTTRIDLADNC